MDTEKCHRTIYEYSVNTVDWYNVVYIPLGQVFISNLSMPLSWHFSAFNWTTSSWMLPHHADDLLIALYGLLRHVDIKGFESLMYMMYRLQVIERYDLHLASLPLSQQGSVKLSINH